MGSIKSLHSILTLQTTIFKSSNSPVSRYSQAIQNTYNQIIKFTEMAKQKIVVKVTMNSDKKTRKALKIAVSLCGVESASLVGSDKDQIAVTGEGIDSVELTTLLRKRVGYTELVSVGPVEEKKKPEAKESKATVEVNPYEYYYNYYGTPYYVY